MTIRLERDDALPAFAGFLRCEEQHSETPVVFVNVQLIMAPEHECRDGTVQKMTREDRKRLLVTSLMHEFGHVLESYFRLPVNEEAIEKACEEWETAYATVEEPDAPDQVNHDVSVGEMLDEEDEAAIGLLGRPAVLQFVRLCTAYNDKKKAIQDAINMMSDGQRASERTLEALKILRNALKSEV